MFIIFRGKARKDNILLNSNSDFMWGNINTIFEFKNQPYIILQHYNFLKIDRRLNVPLVELIDEFSVFPAKDIECLVHVVSDPTEKELQYYFINL